MRKKSAYNLEALLLLAADAAEVLQAVRVGHDVEAVHVGRV